MLFYYTLSLLWRHAFPAFAQSVIVGVARTAVAVMAMVVMCAAKSSEEYAAERQ